MPDAIWFENFQKLLRAANRAFKWIAEFESREDLTAKEREAARSLHHYVRGTIAKALGQTMNVREMSRRQGKFERICYALHEGYLRRKLGL